MHILVVDDSPVLRMLLCGILEEDGHTVTTAVDGERALKLLETIHPDIVTMDVHMPGMNGFETTARILERYALPIVVVTSSANAKAASTAMRALEAGALAVVEKPGGPDTPNFERRTDELLRTLRNMSQVKVVRRHRKGDKPYASVPEFAVTRPGAVIAAAEHVGRTIDLVAIGASAGGPGALKTFLHSINQPQPWAFAIVQHIAAGFVPSFVQWLQSLTSLKVKIAEQDETLQPGHIYVAPDGFHLSVTPYHRVFLFEAAQGDLICPSADALFNSVAQSFGAHAVGIQLSGMGKDGASGLAQMATAGALTIAQAPGTALIDSMPRSAIELNGANLVLPPAEMAILLNSIASVGVTKSFH